MGARPFDLMTLHPLRPVGIAAALALTACSFGSVNPGPLDGGPPVHDGDSTSVASNIGAPCQGEGLACDSENLCVSGACRTKCSSEGCATGERCIYVAPSDGGRVAVCVDSKSLECDETCQGDCPFCPQGTSCSTGNICRDTCSKTVPCLIGETCVDQICTGATGHPKAPGR